MCSVGEEVPLPGNESGTSHAQEGYQRKGLATEHAPRIEEEFRQIALTPGTSSPCSTVDTTTAQLLGQGASAIDQGISPTSVTGDDCLVSTPGGRSEGAVGGSGGDGCGGGSGDTSAFALDEEDFSSKLAANEATGTAVPVPDYGRRQQFAAAIFSQTSQFSSILSNRRLQQQGTEEILGGDSSSDDEKSQTRPLDTRNTT